MNSISAHMSEPLAASFKGPLPFKDRGGVALEVRMARLNEMFLIAIEALDQVRAEMVALVAESRALKLPIGHRLKRLLIKRRDQLGGALENTARFIVVQPGDSMHALECELGWSIFVTPEGHRFGEADFYPGWEWLADHGHCFELVFILTDDGFAHVVLIANLPDVDSDLLEMCRMYVTDKV